MNRSLSHAALVLWTAASMVVSPLYAQADMPPSPQAKQVQASALTPRKNGQAQAGLLASEPNEQMQAGSSAFSQDNQNQPQGQAQPQTTPQTQPTATPPRGQTSASSTATGPIAAKALPLGRDYSKGKPFFPNPFAAYSPVKVDEPTLTNTPKIDQLVQDGKLMLSLDDAISLALENNLDIRVQRYTVWIIDTQLLKAKAGAIPQPASAQQVVLGLPPATSFDPVLSARTDLSNALVPVNNIFTAGVGTTTVPQLNFHTNDNNFSYVQGFHTGTAVQLQWQNQRQSTNSPGVFFNPDVFSSLSFQITQPLLNGCCKLANTRFIIEAKNSQKIATAQFEQSVIADITTTSNDYWELVFDRQNIKVEEEAVSVSQKLYEDNKKQLEIGTMAPLDVITAESQLASDKQALVQAQTAMLLQEAKLLFDITKNPLTDNLASIEIVPTTPIETPEVVESVALDELMNEAWQKRPEMTQSRLTLENDKIEVNVTRNALLPSLTLFGFYQGQAFAGNQTVQSQTVTGFAADLAAPIVNVNGVPTSNPALYAPTPLLNTLTVVKRTGVGTALDQMINASNPTYEGGINLSLPLRNRSAQADSARAMLSERQQEVLLRQLRNTIFVNVRQAQVSLAQDRAQVEATGEARKLAQQTLDAEQKKYQLGSSNSYTVVLRVRDLTIAETNELRAQVNLIEAMVAFNQAMGRTLEANKITLADAFHGKVSRTPNIPGALDADDPPVRQDSWEPGKK
jgi:outer membrane protein